MSNLTENVKKVKKDMEQLYAQLVKEMKTDEEAESVKREVGKDLSVILCKMVTLIIDNAHQKMEEIIVADEKKWTVNDKTYGADLYDEKGNPIELKVSKGKAKTNYKTNFNWPVPKPELDVKERRPMLLKQVKEKTGGSDEIGVQFVAKNSRNSVINVYEFSGKFIYSYFAYLPDNYFPKCDKYNFGCTRCKKCEKYHRLEYLKQLEMDVKTADAPEALFEKYFQKLRSRQLRGCLN